MRRAVMELCTSFPDDQVDAGDEILIPGGSVLSSYIRDMIDNVGMSTSDPVIDKEYGWQFWVIDGRKKYLLTITDLEGLYVLQMEVASSLLARIFIKDKNVENFVYLVEQELMKSTVVSMKSIEFK